MRSVLKKVVLSVSVCVLSAMMVPGTASAGENAWLGEINYVGFNFTPKDWASCNGQIIPISQNQALYSLLGTTYGGDGRTNFALPDMRGRVPIHQGQGVGLQTYPLGYRGGLEATNMSIPQLPAHSHDNNATSKSTSVSVVAAGATATSTLHVNDGAGNATPTGNYLAGKVGLTKIYTSAAPNADLNAGSVTTTLSGVDISTTTQTTTTVTVGNTGSSKPFSIMQPFLVVNCVIAMDGTYPSRN